MKLSKPADIVLLSGLLIRLGLAPFTGQPYDMGTFVVSQRLFYQSGIFDLKYFPTLPTLYYVQLLFYACYAMLSLAGIQDFQYYYHTTMMVEGSFLKLPFILADVGIFIVMLRVTRKLLPATLFFLNPFPIYLSAVWGMYDSLMLFPLLLGMSALANREDRTGASFMFILSGALKFFGFLACALVVCESVIRHRFRDEVLFEILGGLAVVASVIIPAFLVGGFQAFLHGIIFRFIGLSGASSATAQYNLFEVLLKTNPSEVFPVIPLAVALVCVGYSYESIRTAQHSKFLLLLKWTLIGALAFSLFSTSEPQWLSWLVPLGILYGSLTGRGGLQYFTYVFGVVVTFLTITLLQGIAYLLIGTNAIFNTTGYIEGIPGGTLLYAVMTLIMMILFSSYLLFKKLKSFSLEVIPLIGLVYLQSYFWIVIIGVGRSP